MCKFVLSAWISCFVSWVICWRFKSWLLISSRSLFNHWDGIDIGAKCLLLLSLSTFIVPVAIIHYRVSWFVFFGSDLKVNFPPWNCLQIPKSECEMLVTLFFKVHLFLTRVHSGEWKSVCCKASPALSCSVIVLPGTVKPAGSFMYRSLSM